MSVDQLIREALTPIVPAVSPNRYDGEATEYITFIDTILPELDADDKPHALRHLLLINWWLPHGVNPNTKKRLIAERLFGAGCTYPSVTPIPDDDGQHYAFECEAVEHGDV